MRAKPVFFSPEVVFLILGLLAGALLCVFIPFGAGFDEEMHLVRVYDLAGLHFLPNEGNEWGSLAPAEFFRISYNRRALLTPANDILFGPDFYQRIDRDNPMRVPTRSIYPPVSLGLQAVLARLIWLKYNVPIVPGTIALRFAGLCVYLAGVWLAVRRIPIGKWLLVILSLAPMTLFQAATLNADGFTIAASFLFIALALEMYAAAPEPIRPGQVWAAAGVMLLLGAAKPGAVLIIPLLLLLPRERFPSRWMQWLLWLSAAAALALTVGWSLLAVANSHFSAGGDQSVSRQLELMLANPLDFIGTFLRGFRLALPDYARDWIGVYGYWVGAVPPLVYPFFGLALLLAMAAEHNYAWFRLPLRLWFAAVFLLSAGAVLLMYFYANYTPGDASSLGKQGRYFLPMAPLLFLSLAGVTGIPFRKRGFITAAALVSAVITLALYGYGLYASYYTLCGQLVYTGHVCTQPAYKNLDKAGAPEILLDEDALVRQDFTNTCQRLVGVEVLVKSLPTGSGGSIRLALLDPGGNTLAAAYLPFSELTAGQYARLDLDHNPAQEGGRYTIEVSAPENDGIVKPGIALSTADDYPHGRLLSGANPPGPDLIFHYLCDLP